MIRLGHISIILFLGTTLVYGQLGTGLEVQIKGKQFYKVGEPILVRLTVENRSDSLKRIEFTETHNYHKVLPYPTCITASLKDDNGINQCSYPSQYFIWSTLFDERDWKYVDLEPGDKIIRDLIVNEIVSGCICYQDRGLKSGTYLISLAVHGRPTNELKIEVR